MRRLSDRTRRRLLASACALCLATLPMLAGASVQAASAAGFEGGSLNKLTEGQEAETSTTSTAANTTKSESTGTSSSILFIVVGTAVVLLAGVAFVIMRDARRVAPATDVEFAQAASARRSEEALRRRRAKAKAARQQRKRNR